MKTLNLWLTIFLITLCGCGDVQLQPPIDDSTQIDIAYRLYRDDSRIPPDFYRDNTDSHSGYSTVHHLTTRDIDPQQTNHQLCAYNLDEASGMVAKKYRTDDILLHKVETPEYYEFEVFNIRFACSTVYILIEQM
jgi:hypothetical protein